MNFSKEMIEKAKTASSAEELFEMARVEGVEITETEAAQFFNLLHSMQPLSDEELSAVAGGKGGDSEPVKPEPKYHVGQIVDVSYSPSDPSAARGIIYTIGSYNEAEGYNYLLQDPATGKVFPFPLRLEILYVVVVG